MGVIRIESLDEKKVEEVSQRLGQLARSLVKYSTSVRGPVPAPIEKIREDIVAYASACSKACFIGGKYGL